MDDRNDQLSIDITEPAEPMYDKKDQVSIDIMKKLDLVKPVSKTTSDPRIERVPKLLRDVNAKAYEPQLIAIGPYHRRNKPHLQMMEKHKLLYLKMLLQRTKENDVERYVKKMRELEERTRACYIDAVCLKENRFVEMLLLDACFIVELLRKYPKYHRERNGYAKAEYYDPVFHSYWMDKTLGRDLLLVENQIPFFVLDAFFQMIATQNEQNHFLKKIFFFFNTVLPYQRCEHADDHCNTKEIKHLLSFVHDHWFYQGVGGLPISCSRKWNIFKIFCLLGKEDDSDDIDDGKFIRCATKLKEAGIKFRMVERDSLFDVGFENGIMEIPKLIIEDLTESFFRNLIAYEQIYPNESSPVVDYVRFMDCLINSAEDVGLLCQHNIVDNLLGDDEVIANIFNRLIDSVTFTPKRYYTEIYKKVNKHCVRRRNKWMANLKHNYFNTPWALISFLAAVLLLFLTLGQTVFSVLAYITNK